MKRSRFTEEQVVKVVKAVEGGLAIKDAVRQFGVSRATISIWRKKYAGMEVSDAKKLRALEDENRRLKRVVADLTLDKQMLQDALSTKVLKPAGGRLVAAHWRGAFGVSERRAAHVIGMHRSTARYAPRPDNRDRCEGYRPLRGRRRAPGCRRKSRGRAVQARSGCLSTYSCIVD